MIPLSYPATMKDRLQLDVLLMQEEQERIKKFITNLMSNDPHMTEKKAIEEYYKKNQNQKQAQAKKGGGFDEIENKRKLEQY